MGAKNVSDSFIIISITGTTALCGPWPSSGFLNNLIFSVSLFLCLLPLDLSSLGGPTSSYATVDIALRLLEHSNPTTTLR
jgi:hypothetical protein